MNVPEATPPSPATLFELVKQKDRKRASLIDALHLTRIDRANVFNFVAAMNELPVPLAAELIALAWRDLDAECRLAVMREWLDRKDREQQAAGYHALSARLLALDPETAMDLLDRVVKLAAGSPACLRRAVAVTRSDWVGTAPEQARFHRLDPPMLRDNGRLRLLEWLADCCPADTHPADNDRRRADLQKQSSARTALVAEWLEQLQARELPESLAAAVSRSLFKLRPKATAVPPPTLAPIEGTGAPREEAAVVAVPPPAPEKETEPRRAPQAPDHMLREMFDSITRLFHKEAERHHRELGAADAELAAAKSALERAERDSAAIRAANSRSAERITELEEQVRVLHETQSRLERELAEARGSLTALHADLGAERQQKQAIRDEGHEAVSRETQRERERLLTQLGQRIGNIVGAYREIRSRGPLPEGTPAMMGEMVDELLSRLEAAGVRWKRD